MRTTAAMLALSLAAARAPAASRVSSVSLGEEGGAATMTVRFKGGLAGPPEAAVVRGRIVQVSLPGAVVWPRIERAVPVGGGEARVMAYQYTRDVVRARAVLPYDVGAGAPAVSERPGAVELSFAAAPAGASAAAPGADAYDESYLEGLLSDREIEGMASAADAADAADAAAGASPPAPAGDLVGVRMSGRDRGALASLLPYLGRFGALLGAALLAFLLLAWGLKRTVFSRGRLGFLSGTRVVQVLDRTAIAPRRTIVTVRAHGQVLLVGVDDKGMHFLAEVRDPAGLVKEGERRIAGDNFDTRVEDASAAGRDFPLKGALDGPAPKERIADRIRKKVKDLKSLQ